MYHAVYFLWLKDVNSLILVYSFTPKGCTSQLTLLNNVLLSSLTCTIHLHGLL